MIGRTLSHYRIVEKIGSGGMGEVYVAEDTKLGRQVALKVLRPEAVGSPERRKRFEQEAKALAALNHPNIVSVYSVEEAEGVDFITMELVRGQPLSRRIPKGGLPLGELLEFAIPLADALAAAHEQGITHRDLKPDNVMVGAEGRVKVLDFGLAKLRQESLGAINSQFPTESRTGEGQVVGTVAYMSPEQAEGRAVDHRSDIFSLGIVLYEMATGERPFRGENATSVLTSILRDTPRSVTELRPELPKELGKIVRRALAKDREQRIQTAKELRNDLVELKAEVESGEAWERPVKGPSSRRKWAALAGVGVVGLAVAVGIWVFSSREPARRVTVTPLTSDPSEELFPALSPDGKLLAFTRVNEKDVGLYVKQVAGGEPLRIAQGMYGGSELSWSPDGQEIAFFRQVARDDGSVEDVIVAMAALGGPERQVATAETRYHGLAWSPDGKLLAITHRGSPEERDGIFLLSLDTGERRRLTQPPPEFLTGDSYPRFSPDGRSLAFVRGTNAVLRGIYVVPVRGGEARRLAREGRYLAGLDWSPDGDSLVFSSWHSPLGPMFRLWRVAATGGESEPLVVGDGGSSPTLSRQGNRLAYVKADLRPDIWRVRGPSNARREEPPKPFISSTWAEWYPFYSPDGKRILFSSTRSGYWEEWVCDSDGSNPRQITFLREPLSPAWGWSPDGRQIAITRSPSEDNTDLFLTSPAGGTPRRLTATPWNEDLPSWSRDGRWIYYSSNRGGSGQLWKMPAEGGEATQVTRNGGVRGLESPDGQFLYLTKSHPEGGPPGIWRMPLGGGEEEQVVRRGFFAAWDVFERGIAYLNLGAEPAPTIEFLDFATREVGRLAVAEKAFPYSISMSPDGRWILYARVEGESDIMLVENFR